MTNARKVPCKIKSSDPVLRNEIHVCLSEKRKSIHLAATLSATMPRHTIYSDDHDVVHLPPDLVAQFENMAAVDGFPMVDKILLIPNSLPLELLSELEKLVVPLVMSRRAMISFRLDCRVVRYLLDLVERVIETF
jgi:hypothetical protein